MKITRASRKGRYPRATLVFKASIKGRYPRATLAHGVYRGSPEPPHAPFYGAVPGLEADRTGLQGIELACVIQTSSTEGEVTTLYGYSASLASHIATLYGQFRGTSMDTTGLASPLLSSYRNRNPQFRPDFCHLRAALRLISIVTLYGHFWRLSMGMHKGSSRPLVVTTRGSFWSSLATVKGRNSDCLWSTSETL